MGGDAQASQAPSDHRRTASHTINESSSAKPSPSYPYQRRIKDHYDVVGFISSGTYGKVYKATAKGASTDTESKEVYAIKKFKPDKEGEVQYTGISQSAIREMALCTELSHDNVIRLVEIIMEAKRIYMIFEYAEHDLLQIIHWHTQHSRTPIPSSMLRSVIYQLLDGIAYLHRSWVMHRDLKPANILVSTSGRVKIGDLGLARLFRKPLQSLFTGDKVVVTIWYRAPELLLGSRHYTPAIDLWAVGCILGELMSLRPIFKGEEAKHDNTKKSAPFQTNQIIKIGEILGLPRAAEWPLLTAMPDYGQLATIQAMHPALTKPRGLSKWWETIVRGNNYNSVSPATDTTDPPPNESGLALMQSLLEFDPLRRLSAEDAMRHPFFEHDESGISRKPFENCFNEIHLEYPRRKVSSEDTDMSVSNPPGTKRRAGALDDRPAKRTKDV